MGKAGGVGGVAWHDCRHWMQAMDANMLHTHTCKCFLFVGIRIPSCQAIRSVFELTLQRRSLGHLFWPEIARALTKFAKYWEAVNRFFLPGCLQLTGELAVVPDALEMHTILQCPHIIWQAPQQDPGSKTQDPASRIQDPGSRIQDPGSMVKDPGPSI